MPNNIKFTTDEVDNTLKIRNARISTGGAEAGETRKTGFFNCVTPPVNGYVLYVKKPESIVESGIVLAYSAHNPSSYRDDLGWDIVWDMSGNGRDGSLMNGVIYSDNGFYFSGSDEYIYIQPSTFQFTSVSFWMKTSTNSTESEILSGFFNMGGVVGNIAIQSGYLCATRGEKRRFISKTVNDSEWHFIHMNMVTNLDPQMYIDGDLSTFDTNVSNDRASDEPLIGCRRLSGTYGLFYEGHVSEVYFYNRILSSVEITQNYMGTKKNYGL